MKKYIIILFVGILIFTMALVSVGCTTTTAETTTAETTTAATTTAQGKYEYKPSKWIPEMQIPMVGPKKIAILGSWLVEAQFWLGGVSEMENQGWNWYFQQCNGDLATQISQIDNVIAKGGWDAVFIDSIDTGGIVDSIKKLNTAGYPVFCYDRQPDEGKIEFVSAADHGGTAAKAAENVVQLLTKKNGAPKGKVIAIITSQEVDSHRVRIEGMREVFAKYPDIEVVEKLIKPDVDSSISTLKSALLAEKNVDAIWNQVDWYSSGWEQGLKEIDKWYPAGDPKHIIIVSQDGHDFVLKWVKQGYFDATYDCRIIVWGWGDVWAAAKYFAGENLKDTVGFKIDSPPFSVDLKNGVPYSVTGSILVTKDNCDDPMLWGNMMDKFDAITALLQKGGSTQ